MQCIQTRLKQIENSGNTRYLNIINVISKLNFKKVPIFRFFYNVNYSTKTIIICSKYTKIVNKLFNLL